MSVSSEPRRRLGGPLRILGSRVDAVTVPDALALIRRFLASNQPHHVITGNTLMLLEAQRDEGLRRILEEAALVIPESWGIRWASRKLGSPLQEFIPGIDLMLEVCRLAAEENRSVYLLGSAPGVAEEAGQTLRHQFPRLQIAGTHHGYLDTPHPNPLPSQRGEGGAEHRVRGAELEQKVITEIRQSKPAILFVGMGMPAQEKWIARNLAALGVPFVMGVGGSFDVLSGRLRRAPSWMRRRGVEWSYRLLKEPWRWRRIAQLPVFAWKVWREKRP